MRRFLITSPRFTGQAEVIYNEADVLCKIDCSDTNMNAGTVFHFKNAVGATITDMAARFSADVVIVEADYQVSFDMFWKRYDKKINKARCIILWAKMNKSLQLLAYFGIDPYHKFLKKEAIRAKVDPETYLRNRYWENEYK